MKLKRVTFFIILISMVYIFIAGDSATQRRHRSERKCSNSSWKFQGNSRFFCALFKLLTSFVKRDCLMTKKAGIVLKYVVVIIVVHGFCFLWLGKSYQESL